MNKRFHYIDVAKGLLILFLPIHHYWSALSRLNLHTNYDWLISKWQLVFLVFFMPAFFLISGYCSNFNKKDKEFWIGNFKGIVIPYFTFTIIGCIINIIKDGNINNF